jgi:hypothetical protein
VVYRSRSRRPPISLSNIVARTEGYTCDAKVWNACVHRSRPIFCRPVANPDRPIRYLYIAACIHLLKVLVPLKNGRPEFKPNWALSFSQH